VGRCVLGEQWQGAETLSMEELSAGAAGKAGGSLPTRHTHAGTDVRTSCRWYPISFSAACSCRRSIFWPAKRSRSGCHGRERCERPHEVRWPAALGADPAGAAL
jgi:hypothetical protein